MVPQDYSDKIKVRARWRQIVQQIGLKSAYDRLRNWWRAAKRHRYIKKGSHEGLRPSWGGSPDILFHIVHEKFARYLQPITEVLPQSYAYLLAVDNSLMGPLTQLGCPYLDLTPNQMRLTKGLVQRALRGFTGLTEAFDKIYTALACARPRCVVVAEGNSPLDVITSEACKQLSIPVLCIQQGWSPYVHSGFRNMSFTKMLVWGRGFVEILKSYNPRQEFVAVGNHILQNVAASMGEQSGKLRKGVSFFLQAPCPLLSNTQFTAFLKLIEWTARTFPDTPVLVREHPGHPLSVEAKQMLLNSGNVRLLSPATYPLEEMFVASRISVTVFSTTILESIAVGILPIVCNISSLPRYFPDVAAAGAGIEVRTISEAEDAIRRVLEDTAHSDKFQNGMMNFRKRFFEVEEPIKRIADEIIAACGQSNLKAGLSLG
jgi:hypothetical protein